MRRQAIDREKMFANYLSDKELVYRIYKEPSKLNISKIYKGLIQLNIKKPTQLKNRKKTCIDILPNKKCR